MKEVYEKIWDLAEPYLRKGTAKDFALHTQGVVKAMELILKEEKGNDDILIPAAILHDVGWSKVPSNLQRSREEADRKKALELHLEYAAPIIEEILGKVDYNYKQIQRVVDIVKSHKFKDPSELEKQLLIDADTAADAFKEQFYSDVESYETTPEKLYDFRKKNEFYTATARKIFERELEERRKEIKNKD